MRRTRLIGSILTLALVSLGAAAVDAAGGPPAPDYGDHRCFWSPFNQQERGDHGGPWNCNETVGVTGNHMTLNGWPWRSRGVTLQGFVRLHDEETQTQNPLIYAAYNAYGPPELRAMHAFGADTIRFQVSQPSLDPEANQSDYVSAVVSAIKQARQAGFVVMIMMQDETISGSDSQQPLATAQTLRDWDVLNSIFAQDRGVLYELYNEPRLVASSTNWGLWKSGGTTGAEPSIGMQTMIAHLRANGSTNVFVLDGLEAVTNGITEAAATLQGLPSIADPLGRVVYAVHPYPHQMPADPQLWDIRFGNASRTIPVDADEWSAKGGVPATGPVLGLGSLPTYDVAVQFLDYVRAHPTMSLGAGAFDIPYFMTQNVTTWQPTNYDNYSSTSPTRTQNDAGLLVHILYATNYWYLLTCADGVTPGANGNCSGPGPSR